MAERLRMIESFSNQIQVALFDGKISAAERQHLDKWRLSEGMTTSERNNVLRRHGIKDIDAWPQKEPPSRRRSVQKTSSSQLRRASIAIIAIGGNSEKRRAFERRRQRPRNKFPREHLWRVSHSPVNQYACFIHSPLLCQPL